MYATKYARVSHQKRSGICCAAISHCQRSAIGRAVPTMIATERANHHGSASTRMSTVWWRSIFQTRYASANPVKRSVRVIRSERFFMP